MVRPTTTDGQIRSESHEERSLCTSEYKGLHSGGSKTSPRRLGKHTSNPRANQWPALLEELDVQFLMLDTDHDAELLELFQAHPGWAIDSQDDQSMLLVRRDFRPTVVPSKNRGLGNDR
jgi:hypothetical protein